MPRSKATSTADRLSASSTPQYRFVGGKGGVGKTTCAASMGIESARHGRMTLVISTEPAPSLGDALLQRLGPRPRPVRGVPRLDAAEVDARAALDRWMAPRRSTLEEVALRGTWLDREDVSRLLRLALPGVDEVAGLLQIADLAGEHRYDRIIVDTAPTGHLLRMFGMPAVLNGVARAFDHMQTKHRIMVEALRGSWSPDAADALIDEMSGDADRLIALLTDSTRARVSWVTLPEHMSIEETADGIRWLSANGIAVDSVIVNTVTPPPSGRCRWCQARRSEERRAIDALRRGTTPGMRLAAIPRMDKEPRGRLALGSIGRLLERTSPAVLPPSRPIRSPITAMMPHGVWTEPAEDLVTPETRLVMFGGKGGVGKTTCAAAVAVDLAAQQKHRRVLLLSADPAHSTGDVFGQRFSDTPRRIVGGPANLTVRELDADAAFKEMRETIANAIEDLFARVSRGGGIETSLAAHDRQVMRDLLELAPPGVDELVAIIEVTQTLAVAKGRQPFDLIVIDTAPTGHALRLIEMPTLVHEWVKAVMAILLKYQQVVGLGELAAVLVRLSQGLAGLREVMADSVRTRFIAVTRAAALPRAETARLLRRLASAKVSVPAVIVNAVGSGTCLRCRRDRRADAEGIAALRKELIGSPGTDQIVIAPAVAPAPHGPERLHAWRSAWVWGPVRKEKAIASKAQRPRPSRGRKS
jgi:arsenite-transporting ATPase